jgi:hypothetical protein
MCPMNDTKTIGIAIRVRVSGHPWVFDPMDVSVGAILCPWITPAPDPYRAGINHEFLLAPTSDPAGA